MKKCNRCGTIIENENSNYCIKCGAKLTTYDNDSMQQENDKMYKSDMNIRPEMLERPKRDPLPSNKYYIIAIAVLSVVSLYSASKMVTSFKSDVYVNEISQASVEIEGNSNKTDEDNMFDIVESSKIIVTDTVSTEAVSHTEVPSTRFEHETSVPVSQYLDESLELSIEKSKVYSLYQHFILEKIKSGEFIENADAVTSGACDDLGYMFDLHDIDNDGIEELFVSNGFFAGSCVWIYTVLNNEVIELTSYENHGMISLYGGKYLLFGSINGQAGGSDGCFCVKDGPALRKVVSFYNDENSDLRQADYITIIINNEAVSENEYNEEMSVYENMKIDYLGRNYVLQYYEIIDVFGKDNASNKKMESDDDSNYYTDSYFDETCRLYHNEKYNYDAVYPIEFEYVDSYEDGAFFYDRYWQQMSIIYSENTNQYDSKKYLEYIRNSEPRISYSYYNDENEYVGYTFYYDDSKTIIMYGVAIVRPSHIITMLLTVNATDDGECTKFGDDAIQSMLDFARLEN